MFTVDTSLAEHAEQIITALLNLLEGQRTPPSGTLQDVKSIIRGDRTTPGKLPPPALWVFPGPDMIQPAGGHANIHNFEFIVAAVVQHSDPEEGHKAATNLAARAYDVLLLDKSWNNTVHTVVPVRFDPSYEKGNAANLYWAAVVVNGIVRRRD